MLRSNELDFSLLHSESTTQRVSYQGMPDDPAGALDFDSDRLVNQLPAFRSVNTTPADRQKKKIVLHDPNLAFEPVGANTISALLKAGFKIYLLKDGSYQPINSVDLDEIETVEFQSRSDAITGLATQLHEKSDHIFALNAFSLSQLNEVPFDYTLPTEMIDTFIEKTQIELEETLSLFLSESPSYEFCEALAPFITHLTSADAGYFYYRTDSFISLFDRCRSLKSLDTGWINISAINLIDILNSLPTLEHLAILFNGYDGDVLTSQRFNLKSLKLTLANINAEQLNAVLDCFPTLEELAVDESQNESSSLLPKSLLAKPARLPKLQKISSDAKWLDEDFDSLFKATHQLKEIAFTNTAITLPRLSHLHHMKTINFRRAHLSGYDLNELFEDNPELENLIIPACTSLGYSIFYCYDYIPKKLKIIDVSLTGISSNELTLVSKSPVLEKMILSGCEGKEVKSWLASLAPCSLMTLKSIKLLDIYGITLEHLNCLLQAAPEIEEILLSNKSSILCEMDELNSIDKTKLYFIGNLKDYIFSKKRPARLPSKPSSSSLLTQTSRTFVQYKQKKISLESIKPKTTLSKPTTFNCIKFFSELDGAPEIPVEGYRLQAYHLNDEGTDLVEYQGEFSDRLPHKKFTKHYHKYQCTFNPDINQTSPYPLPSARRGEVIDVTSIEVYSKEGKRLSHDLWTLQYCEETNFYRLHMHSSIEVDVIKFILHVPTPSKLSKKYRNLEKKYQRYPDNIRCIKRSIEAYKELKQQGKKALIIGNACHAFVEKKERSLELGGSPAEIRIHSPSQPSAVEPPQIAYTENLPTVLVSDSLVVSAEPPAPSSVHKKNSFETFAHFLATPFIRNTVSLSQVSANTALTNLYRECKLKNMPFLLLTEPSDLSFTRLALSYNGKTIQNVLSRFIDALSCDSLLCIDTRTWSDKEIISLNDFLDEIKKRDLPFLRCMILTTPKHLHYGKDFQRRIDDRFQITSEPSLKELPASISGEEHTVKINLFYSANWKRELLGYFNSTAEDISSWVPGKLLTQEGLCSGSHLIFENAPWYDPEFKSFIERLEATGEYQIAERVFSLPKGVTLTQKTGYDWQALTDTIDFTPMQSPLHDELMLFTQKNKSLFFHQTYEINSDNEICFTENYLDTCREKNLHVLFSSQITEHHLAQLLTAAKERNVKVHVHYLESQRTFLQCLLPTELKSTLPRESEMALPLPNANIACFIMEKENDIKLLAAEADLCISMDNLQAYELEKLLLPIMQAGSRLRFRAQDSAIASALTSGGKVVLFGKSIPLQLEEALLRWRYLSPALFSGHLSICIGGPKSIAEQTLINILHMPVTNLPSLEKFEIASFDDTQHKELIKQACAERNFSQACNQLDKLRLAQINAAFEHHPWAVIKGKTGIGKTDFVFRVLKEEENTKIYTSIETWLNALENHEHPEKRKILFIDEMNLFSQVDDGFLSACKSLRYKRSFHWKGKNYSLSPNDLMLFAGNPASYGSGRINTDFLEEPSALCSFDELPDWYLGERIILPLLAKLEDDTRHNMMRLFFEVYHFIKAHEDVHTFITPRELKSMALMTLAALKKNSSASPQEIASFMAYEIGKNCLAPYAPAPVQQAFSDQFSRASQLNYQLECDRHFDYRPYHSEAWTLINTLLTLRDDKSQTDSGLGGFILEGPSGVGKTTLIQAALTSWHYTQITDPNQIIDEENNHYYVVISAGMSFTEKEKWLDAAFEHDWLVVAEELNANNWPNRKLNAYLSGYNTEGKKLDHALTLFGGQNPASEFKGREIDPSLERRCLTVNTRHWPVYTKSCVKLSENKHILFSPPTTPPIATSSQRIKQSIAAGMQSAANTLTMPR